MTELNFEPDLSFSELNKLIQNSIKKNKHSIIDRFWKYTNKGKKDECWEWQGSTMLHGGYGQLSIGFNRSPIKAHRLSYMIHYGEIPKNLFICHKCNNPLCVNPNHIYAGTPNDNWKDTINSGNAYKFINLGGEQCRAHKLTNEQVDTIKNSTESSIDLANKYKVSRQSIWKIRKGKTWKTTV